MRLKSLPLLAISIMMGACCANKTETPASLTDIDSNGVMGLLPRKLGTVMHIEGRVIEHNNNTKSMERIHILVSKVDGLVLPSEVQMDVAQGDNTPLKKGDTVRLIAHETGAYEGQVIDHALVESGIILLSAVPNYHFHTRLVIICTEAEAAERLRSHAQQSLSA